ncbi:MAG: NYN domain-containing protein, partial [Lachnospiraceae bacterium]|nr:NYN domain-containing protein [Lachnospiraceae bacterium]
LHVGVLTGSAITDIKITLTAGQAHQKHTEGGDFRQATYRALRQGLMQARSVLLEPWYEFRLEIPGGMVGRAMSDLEKYGARFELEGQSADMAGLTGEAPVSQMQEYQKEVIAYSRGNGKLSCTLKGYLPCHNTGEVMERISYDPLRDMENPASSVFCAHGAGFVVEWDQVPDYMHLESTLRAEDMVLEEAGEAGDRDGQIPGIRPDEIHGARTKGTEREERSLGLDEIDAILQKTSHANRRESREIGREGWKRTRSRSGVLTPAQSRVYKPQPPKEKNLLVDGYNIIFAWQELKELAQINLDGARGKLLDILCNYQAIRRCNLIVVFDAYRLAGHPTEILEYHNIHVVYTKEAETADRY